ncbi:GLPGLI family protein [Muricauda brasiliensis]|jgi:GLPGLI family protein|uniref:GLPGLI family protein n=1 Tax=Muricauda brasiliensis TaxID=2162892 RepID=UPI000D36A360|nr:GLPGLI family protein [Muricauda brasiliensis]
MKRLLSTFILIAVNLFQAPAISQVSSGTIRYSVNVDAFVARVKKNNEAKKISRKSNFETIAEEMHRIKLNLLFKDSKSVFLRESSLALDNSERAFQMAVAFADRGTYYTDIKTRKLLIYREYKGEVILVDSNIRDVDWDLTAEQKKIANFNCYKAVSQVETSIGKLPIIAWYTPEIPVSFGPTDYSGTLPGLILELHTNEISFICEEINLNQNNIIIEWPNTDSAITLEEYEKMNENLAKSFQRN